MSEFWIFRSYVFGKKSPSHLLLNNHHLSHTSVLVLYAKKVTKLTPSDLQTNRNTLIRRHFYCTYLRDKTTHIVFVNRHMAVTCDKSPQYDMEIINQSYGTCIILIHQIYWPQSKQGALSQQCRLILCWWYMWQIESLL